MNKLINLKIKINDKLQRTFSFYSRIFRLRHRVLAQKSQETLFLLKYYIISKYTWLKEILSIFCSEFGFFLGDDLERRVTGS